MNSPKTLLALPESSSQLPPTEAAPSAAECQPWASSSAANALGCISPKAAKSSSTTFPNRIRFRPGLRDSHLEINASKLPTLLDYLPNPLKELRR